MKNKLNISKPKLDGVTDSEKITLLEIKLNEVITALKTIPQLIAESESEEDIVKKMEDLTEQFDAMIIEYEELKEQLLPKEQLRIILETMERMTILVQTTNTDIEKIKNKQSSTDAILSQSLVHTIGLAEALFKTKAGRLILTFFLQVLFILSIFIASITIQPFGEFMDKNASAVISSGILSPIIISFIFNRDKKNKGGE